MFKCVQLQPMLLDNFMDCPLPSSSSLFNMENRYCDHWKKMAKECLLVQLWKTGNIEMQQCYRQHLQLFTVHASFNFHSGISVLSEVCMLKFVKMNSRIKTVPAAEQIRSILQPASFALKRRQILELSVLESIPHSSISPFY